MQGPFRVAHCTDRQLLVLWYGKKPFSPIHEAILKSTDL